MHSNMTAFGAGLCYMEARFTLHLYKIFSASCSAHASTFSKIQRQFPSYSYLLLSPLARFFTRHVTQKVLFSNQPVSCALFGVS